jgi:uncharacterized protein YndB with AHSA1/START domain
MSIPLIKEFNYDSPVESVWDALTDTDKMKQWYFPQLYEFKPIAGYKFQFDDEGGEYRKEWIVTKVTAGKMLAHSWAYQGYPGSSEVIFELAAGSKTTLKVTQTGLESFPDHPHFKRERFEWGWENLLGQNLKHLLESYRRLG